MHACVLIRQSANCHCKWACTGWMLVRSIIFFNLCCISSRPFCAACKMIFKWLSQQLSIGHIDLNEPNRSGQVSTWMQIELEYVFVPYWHVSMCKGQLMIAAFSTEHFTIAKDHPINAEYKTNAGQLLGNFVHRAMHRKISETIQFAISRYSPPQPEHSFLTTTKIQNSKNAFHSANLRVSSHNNNSSNRQIMILFKCSKAVIARWYDFAVDP